MSDEDLVRHVAGSLGIDVAEARRVILDIAHYFSEPLETYIRRRHSECRSRGMRNEVIYGLLQRELENRPIAAPTLSVRQVRRIIYS